jgi:threonine dehydrogenase-like Zn-dependent dehydrogenase
VYLSDVLPTAWQAVAYADVPAGGSLLVLGLGPIGDMATRVAQHLGVETVIGVDLVPDRLARATAHGVRTIDLHEHRADLGEIVAGWTECCSGTWAAARPHTGCTNCSRWRRPGS